MSLAELRRREGHYLSLALVAEILCAESSTASLALDHGVCWLIIYTCELLQFTTRSTRLATVFLCICLILDVGYIHIIATGNAQTFFGQNASFDTSGASLQKLVIVVIHAVTLGLVALWLLKVEKGVMGDGGRDGEWSMLIVPGLVGCAWATMVQVLLDDLDAFGPVYMTVAAPAATSLGLASNLSCLGFIALLPFLRALVGLAPLGSIHGDVAKLFVLLGVLTSMAIESRAKPRERSFAKEATVSVVKGAVACGFVLSVLRDEGGVVVDRAIACGAAVLACVAPKWMATRIVVWTVAVALAWQSVGGQWTLVGANFVAFVSVVVNAMGDQAFPEAIRVISCPLLVFYLRTSGLFEEEVNKTSGKEIEVGLETKADVFLRLLALSFQLSVLAWMWTGKRLNMWSKTVHAYVLTVVFVIDAVWPPLHHVRYNLFIALLTIESSLCTTEQTTLFLAIVVARIVLLELGVSLESAGTKKAVCVVLLLVSVPAAAYLRLRSVPSMPTSRWLLQSGGIGICFAGAFAFAWFELSFMYVATLSPVVITTVFTAGLVNLPKELTLRWQSIVATNSIGATTLVFVTALCSESTNEAELDDLTALRKGLVLLTGIANAVNALWLGTTTKHPPAMQKRCASVTALLAFIMIYISYVLSFGVDVHVVLLLSPLLYFAGYVLESETARPFGMYLASVSLAILLQSLYRLLLQDIPYSGDTLAHNSLYVESNADVGVSVWNAEDISTPFMNMGLLLVAASPMYGLVRFFASSKFSSKDTGTKLLPIQTLPLLFADLYEAKLLSMLVLIFATIRYIAAKRMFAKLEKLL